jgi:hypothetical protein
MTIYQADPLPIHAFSSAQASEIGDTINKPGPGIPPMTLDFSWTPFTATPITIGETTVTVNETAISTVITFTAAVTLAPNRSVVNYEWAMGDGTVYQTGTDTVTHTYLVANYQARASLVITDDLGNTYSVGHQLYLVS